MGRIEDALRKLEEERRRSPVESRPALDTGPIQSSALKPLKLEPVGSVSLDELQLRRWGPVLLNGTERSRKEYGQIKRPIVDQALGRTASTTPARNIVLVTSAVAGEGKSVTAFNLALSLALEKDFSVVLIDADIIKSDLSRALNLDRSAGITDLLADDNVQFNDILWGTTIPSLFFVPAGTQRSSATELLGSQRMRQLTRAIANELPRAIVVMDSSPLLLTNESPVLVSLAGQVVLVVRANTTSKLQLDDALDRLDKTKPIGLVLNGVSSAEGGYYGSYDGHESTVSSVVPASAGA